MLWNIKSKELETVKARTQPRERTSASASGKASADFGKGCISGGENLNAGIRKNLFNRVQFWLRWISKCSLHVKILQPREDGE